MAVSQDTVATYVSALAVVLLVVCGGAFFALLLNQHHQEQAKRKEHAETGKATAAPTVVRRTAVATREAVLHRHGVKDAMQYNTAPTRDDLDADALMSTLDSDGVREIYNSVHPDDVVNTQLLLESFDYNIHDLLRYEHDVSTSMR